MAEDLVFEKALQKTLRLLALRGRSEKELRRKLGEKGFDESVLNRVVSRLLELGYLDDGVFARDWARNLAVNRLYGNRRIEGSLLEKGIPRDMIKEILADMRRELPERKSLSTLLQKKLKDRRISDIDKKEKIRLAQSLMNKGYPAGLIFDALGNKEEEAIDDRE